MKELYNIKLPKTNAAFSVKTPPDMWRLHTIGLAVCKKGGGKSVAMSNMLRIAKANGCLDVLFIVSSTYFNNKTLFDNLDFDEENHLFDPNDRDVVEQIHDAIDILAYEYDEYHEKMRLYKERQRLIRNTNVNIEDIDYHIMMQSEKPYHKYNGRKPIIHLVADDCQGSKFFSNSSGICNMCIRHRHLGKTRDGALGISLYFSCQSYKSQANGIPKVVRLQVNVILMFKTQSPQELDSLYDEISGDISRSQFDDMYKRALINDHDFLFIDLNPTSKDKRFRRNFNEFLK